MPLDVSEASQKAQATGRDAVAAGMTDVDTIRRLYQEYTQYLQQGTTGTFQQLLLARGVIDKEAFKLLGGISGEEELSPTEEEELIVERTLEFDRVLPTAPLPTPAPLPIPAPLPTPAPVPNRATVEVAAPSEADLDLAVDDSQQEEAAFFAEGDGGQAKEPQVGEVLGEFELLSILGRGGMGVIYKVKHIGNGKIFALKTLLPGPTQEAIDRERFQREVEALRRLDHENIITVHACGRTDDIDWYTMDLIEGQELKDVMQGGGLKQWEKLSIFEDVCKAIAHAHERGIVHRDLKPANISITPEKKVIVLDFGIAKLTQEDVSLTRTGAALGTPLYMSPEQLIDPKNVDHRTDVYALGAMLYELMTGRPPFSGETYAEIGNKVVNDQVIPPTMLDDSLHPGMDAICLKALEKDKQDRYDDVDDMRREVAKYRRGSKGASKMALAQDGLRRFLKKHRTGVIAGVVLASLIYIPLLIIVGMLF